MQDNYKLIRSAALGAILSIISVTAITVAGELYAPLKDWLKAVFTHHWLGKSAVSVIVFVVFSLVGIAVFSNDEEKSSRMLSALFATAVLCTLILAAFFVYHTLA